MMMLCIDYFVGDNLKFEKGKRILFRSLTNLICTNLLGKMLVSDFTTALQKYEQQIVNNKIRLSQAVNKESEYCKFLLQE